MVFSVLGRVRTCVDEAVASCSRDSEASIIAYELFVYRFQPTDPADCLVPFANALDTDNILPSHSCTAQFLVDLRRSLETDRTMASVCQALTGTYLNCLQAQAADPSTLAFVLDIDVDYIGTVRDIFCTPGVFSLCEKKSSVICLVREREQCGVVVVF